MHVIIAGTPVDGFNIYGPFVNSQAAMEWGSSAGGLAKGWWISVLDDSEVEEEETTLTFNGKRYYDPSNWSESQIKHVNHRLVQALDDLGTANETVRQQENFIKDLKNQINDADSQIHRLKVENVQKTGKVSDLQAQLFDARDEIARKSDLLRNASERANTAEDALKESNQRIKNFYTRENARTALEAKIEERDAQITALRCELDDANEHMTKMVSHVIGARTRLTEALQ
jgi:chromosome segregation ATPase